MTRVSILIPARRETNRTGDGRTTLARTVEGVFAQARGEIEVWVGFDGPPYEDLPRYPHLYLAPCARAVGTKPLLNGLALRATGDYLMKLDAHCALSEGFDVTLVESCGEHDVVTPRFYTLNPDTWEWQDERYCDYFLLPCPLTDKKLYRFQAGGYWRSRTAERKSILIDENLKLHGSSFFTRRSHYWAMGGLDETHPDSASGEDIEISLKTWLGPWGGRLLVNKNAWIAHMHKGKNQSRSWNASQRAIDASYTYTANYWMGNHWKGRAHDLDWLIDRFWPIPGWPDDWRALQEAHARNAHLPDRQTAHPL